MCHEFAGKLGKLTSDPFMVNRLLKAFKALRDEDSQETILLTINTDLTEEADKEIQLQFCIKTLLGSDSESTPGAASGSASRKRSEPTRTGKGQKQRVESRRQKTETTIKRVQC